jgi:AraC family transcriptional regulator
MEHPMTAAAAEPASTYLRLDESSVVPSQWRSDDRFSVTRLESTSGLTREINKSSSTAALLVSVSLRPLKAPDYRLWVDGKVIPTRAVPAFRTNVVDFAAEPACWTGSAFHYLHFHLPRAPIDEMAAELGFDRAGAFRLSVLENDVVVAQIAKILLPVVNGEPGLPALALDHVEQFLGAHLLQRYGGVKQRRTVVRVGLATWQRQRVTDLLEANLDGRVRLVELASQCELSVSYFARAFKASFGVSCHQWLTQRRIERARELLIANDLSLADVAARCGFADQAAFTRTFHRVVGVAPGRWRNEHARTAR